MGFRRAANDPATRVTLTKRQREIITLIAKGQTNGEIAAALGLTLDGVKWHVREILARLDVESREQAAAWWQSNRHERAPSLGWLPLGIWAMAAASVVAIVVSVAIVARGGDEPLTPETREAPRTETIDWLPSVSEVRAAASIMNGGPFVTSVPLPLLNDGGSDGEVVRRLFDWLRSAPIADDGFPFRFEAGFRGLVFAIADGSHVALILAANCAPYGSGQGGIRCSQVPDHVDVSSEFGAVRIHSQELSKWIETGWQGDTRTGTRAEYDALWPGE